MPDFIKILNHPLFNVGFFLFIRQITKHLDLENSGYIGMIRTVYLGSILAIILLSYYLMHVIRNKNDTTPLRYVEPGAQQWNGSESADKLINTTHIDYDIEQVKKRLNQGFTSVVIIAFLHLQFGYVQPLIMQSVTNFTAFFISKESRIHFFNGNTSHGELRRPFRIESSFGMGGEKRQPKTDKGSIKRAEKALKAQ